MCGICAFIYMRKEGTGTIFKSSEDSTFQDISGKLKRRGPNHLDEISCSFQDTIDLHFSASVLHLRGTSPAWQPIADDAGNILLWNGEIFDGFELEDEYVSDTEVLSKKLFNCTAETEVLSVMSTIKGPYSIIFYQNTGFLWFGRDVFGRRSLLWNKDNLFFRLCSVSSKQDKWKEVPTEGLFCLDLNQSCIKKTFVVYLYPWSSCPSGLSLQQKNVQEITNSLTISSKSQSLIQCTVSNPLNRTLPTDDVFVGFETSTDKEHKLSDSELLSKLAEVPVLRKTVSEFEDILSASVRKRVRNHYHLCKNCYIERENDSLNNLSCGHASVGVLFSGGLDSIVIACLADRHLMEKQPIDLINVAFASNSSLKGCTTHYGHPAFATPDRLTGRKGVAALRKICPHRNWNFIEVNVTEEDLVCQRRDTISHLLNPSHTVLDDSIGCALWFAANGSGIVNSDEGYKSYKSPARINERMIKNHVREVSIENEYTMYNNYVLLVGMGADEQLGGYARHRAKFNVSGWNGLIEELSLELDRIGSRNLGRDDRIIADNGVESRYPFLDENVVSYLNNIPVWLKMNLNYPRGVGEKLLLRVLALNLGLTEAAVLPKRAIQFGSRIARIENSKEKGSDICERLKAL